MADNVYRLWYLLDDFSSLVTKGKYRKMPYSDWRLLNDYEDSLVEIVIDGPDADLFELNGNSFITNGFWTEDGSFGRYLLDRYLIGKLENPTKKEIKENENMDNLIKGFEFGPCTNNNVKMSLYGLAVQNAAGSWVSYDAKTKTVIDVDILNFDGGKYMYKMPVALKDVAIGDVVIHNRKPVFVTAVASEGDGRISAVDPAAGEEKIILLTRSPFGFDFVTKVVNLFEGFAAGASQDSPFGNILPFILMNDSDNSNDLLPLLFMANGGKVDMSNPMMLYFLAKGNNGSNDTLPLLFLANGSGFAYGRQDPQPQNA